EAAMLFFLNGRGAKTHAADDRAAFGQWQFRTALLDCVLSGADRELMGAIEPPSLHRRQVAARIEVPDAAHEQARICRQPIVNVRFGGRARRTERVPEFFNRRATRRFDAGTDNGDRLAADRLRGRHVTSWSSCRPSPGSS